MIQWPNNSRGRVKSADMKFGNDHIFGVSHFDKMSRWINTLKQFATIAILATVLFVYSTAQAADTFRASHGSLEIVLNLQKAFVYRTNTDFYDVVAFSAATNITMEVTLRNVGEVNMEHIDLRFGLTVIWDGKEYRYCGKRTLGWMGDEYFSPKTAWWLRFPLSDYIPPEALASGRHTIAVKDAGLESNILTTFIETDK